MWDFLTKKCGIFGIEGGTKLWDFQHRGGDFRPLTSGHTAVSSRPALLMLCKNIKNGETFLMKAEVCPARCGKKMKKIDRIGNES